MAWVRLDDQIPRHQKTLKAGPAACWLWVCGIAHCQSQLTDGYISLDVLPMIGVAGLPRCLKLAETLVFVGLFDKAEYGFFVHDYLDYNPSRAAVLQKRAEDAKRKKGTDSNGTPNGIRTESGASRARVLSDPIPTVPIRSDPKETEPRPRASVALSGSLPREHLKHALCDETYSRCVPEPVHAKLVNALAPRHGGDRARAGEELKAFYQAIWSQMPPDAVMGDAFKFWQTHFDRAFATAPPSMGKQTTRLAEAMANIRAEQG